MWEDSIKDFEAKDFRFIVNSLEPIIKIVSIIQFVVNHKQDNDMVDFFVNKD